jgi:tetratricopeptide (TPR) repeat protein
LTLALAAVLSAGCDEPDAIVRLAVSPDGRWAAMLTERGQLGVLDFEGAGPIRIFSHNATSGPQWSPDGKRLTFVEKLPRQASAIWVLHVAGGRRAARPLMVGPSWKADPVWLSDRTVAFVSSREAEDGNLWLVGVRADGTPDRPFRLHDHATDISHVWASPKTAALVFQAMDASPTADGGGSALWLWRAETEQPARLTGGVVEGFADRQSVDFSADGTKLACLVRSAEGTTVEWLDLEGRERLDRIELAGEAGDVLVLGDGRVAISIDKRVVLWRPRARWYQSATERVGYHDVAVRALGRMGEKGMTVVANDSVVLTTEDAEELDEARLHVRIGEDVLRLAWLHAEQGRGKAARRLLDAVWTDSPEGTRGRWLAALAMGELERGEGRWGRADGWLEQAIVTAPDEVLRGAVREERLALTMFDARDEKAARTILMQLDSSGERFEAVDWAVTLPEFVAELQGAKDRKLAREWQRIGGDVRQRRIERAGRRIKEAFKEDGWTTANLHGLQLILEGGFEPLGRQQGRARRTLTGLMDEVAFQEVLLAAMRQPSPPAPAAAELRNLLLEQWVVRGDRSLARRLIADDLANDPEQAAEQIVDLLRQYLEVEERIAWVERMVTDVLLAPDVVEPLLGLLTEPYDRLAVRLAQTRRALLDGDLGAAQQRLGEAWRESAALPSEAMNITRITRERGGEAGGDGDGADGDEAVFRQVDDLFRMELYQAKISERRRRWSDALRAYQACLRLLEQVPTDWDVAPHELVWSIGLIEQGSHDPDTLSIFLRLRDQMGDPLLNPTRDPVQLAMALRNLGELERGGVEPWLAPHVAFCEGLCASLLRRPEPALFHLRRVETLRPTEALRQRALLEEAAVRDWLGQSAQAARLYEKIVAMRLPLAVRATTAVAMIQAERAAGIEREPLERLHEVLPESGLPPAWREWLWLQLGGEQEF